MDLGYGLVQLRPIGVVRNSIAVPTDDCWGGLVSLIELDPQQFTNRSIFGLNEFSHIEVIFLTHRVDIVGIEYGSRHPRNDPLLPDVGILAQRPKSRPNRLGLSRCAVLECSGLCVKVSDLDAIDGSPVLDIKPWFRQFGPRGDVVQPEWVASITENYFQGMNQDFEISRGEL